MSNSKCLVCMQSTGSWDVLQAKALHARPDHPAEAKHASRSDQEVPPPQETVQHAAEAVWSDLVQRVIQQEARSKKFDEIWPRILDSLIQKGFSGVY